MLILNPQDIQSSQLAHNNRYLDTTCPIISYQNLLFIRVTSLTKMHFPKAETICRQFLQQETPLISIILKEENRISVWVEATNQSLIKPKIDKNLKLENNYPNQLYWISLKWLTIILTTLFL